MTDFELRVISKEDFIEKCKQGKCLRQTLKSKQCEKESKQIQCYDKYVKQKQKDFNKYQDPDYKWEQLKEEIKLRDQGCLVMKILTMQELKIVEQQEGFWLNQKFMDGAHIIPRATAPQHIYLKSNVILMGRFFHSRIDKYFDLITGEFIGIEGSANWWTRIMQQNKLWDSNYDYWNFRKDLLGE